MGDWQAWPSVVVRLRNIPQGVTIQDIHETFAQYGEIVYIEQFEDQRGGFNGDGRIRFEPPPTTPFWRLNTYTINYDFDGTKSAKIRLELGPPPSFAGKTRSRVNPRVFYPHKMTLDARSLDFGVTSTDFDIMVKTSIHSSPSAAGLHRVRLEADFRRKNVHILFPHAISLGHQEGGERIREYRAAIDVSQIKQLTVTTSGPSAILTIPLRHPPVYHLKSNDLARSLNADKRVWSSNSLWNRVTHIMRDFLLPQDYTVGLVNAWPDPAFIDIGRWTTLRLHVECDQPVISQFLCALNDLNIDIRRTDKPAERADRPVLLPPENHPVRHHTRYPPPPDPDQSTSALHALRHLAGDDNAAAAGDGHSGGGDGSNGAGAADSIVPYLPFPVQYQLEVCISRHILCEHDLSHQFFAKLRSLSPQRAQFALEYMADRAERVHDPLAVLDDAQSRLYYPSSLLPHYCTVMRKATVTPTTIYFSTPAVESTNRVTRKWHSHIDRFLRVQFTDELFRGKIKTNVTMDVDLFIFKRVYLTLLNGIRIGDRHYKFLAFGNSQIRECGAYFFCETDQLTCEAMRSWMGDFDHIRVVAKFAARLGQCFSTTREVRSIRAPVIRLIDDIERDGFCFTDGVGKISPLLARIVAEDMSHEMVGDEPPSAVQFRMGGCKGVLAVWPEAKGLEVHVRRSQEKFKAQFNGLEIIRCARYATATLNRQTITILTCLGVPGKNFLDMVHRQVAEYTSSMQDQYVAVGLLERHIDENQMALMLKELINYGFMDLQVQEPAVLTFLQLWRAWSMKNLREKARIIVDQSAFVLGCADETGTLRGHSSATEKRGGSKRNVDELPQIFLQIPDRRSSSGYKPVEAVCIVGRNPSLHPGDIRVVQAVDCPALHHLKSVVVFPSTGDKDVPSMLSGGDLDGDDFFVIWDPKLIPPEWNHPPMGHRAAQPETLQRPVSASDLIKFFVKYIRNDCLPLIALSHLASADYLQGGAKHPKCLELAALHSKAVDYVKTGDPAHLSRDLQARRWPHFMSHNDAKPNTYHSTSILGKIYDATSEISFKPLYENEFDKRILDHFPPNDSLLRKARALKTRYDDAMRRLMAQRNVATEFEIFTAFPLSKPKVGNAYKFSEDIGREAGLLKQAFRDEVYKEMGGQHFDIIAPMVAAMYKVTAEEVKIALQEHHRNQKADHGGPKDPSPRSMPIITFPWIFHWVLGRIATGMVRSRDVVTDKAYGVKTQDKPVPAELVRGYQRGATAVAPHEMPPDGETPDGDDKLGEVVAARLPDGQIVHRGEVLNLFDDDQGDADSNYDDIHSHGGDPTLSPIHTALDSEVVPSYQDQQDVVSGSESGQRKKDMGTYDDPFAAVFSLARSGHLNWASQKTTTGKTKDEGLVSRPEEPDSDQDGDESQEEEEALMDRFGKAFNFGQD